ncbi:MAG TPA: sulfite exporter TauE/SafE family protein [Bryobacteraceae bacterium]|jgi:hypothetical protein
MEFVLGFIIAAAIGLTGVGAGVITTPVLILFLGVPAAPAVGTALIFASVVKLLAAPVYVSRKQVHWRTLAFLVAGGLPGVLAGSLLLAHFNVKRSEGLLYSVLGLTIVTMASLNLYKMIRNSTRGEVHDRYRWLPFIALPIGAEVGFSSAGAGALGSIALLGLTTLTAGQVVGTDMFFGLVLSTIGGGIQLHAGNFAPDLLWKLLVAGIPGAIVGANMATRLPSRPLRYALSVWIIGLGAQLCYRGLAS